jgi:hypothetical protein
MAGFDDFLVDELGFLWLREYRPTWEPDAPSGAHRWFVFDSTGVIRTSLRASLPERKVVHIMSDENRPRALIGADKIISLERDRMGTEQVAVYRLVGRRAR